MSMARGYWADAQSKLPAEKRATLEGETLMGIGTLARRWMVCEPLL
jgi:hypothetical protein